MDCYEPREFAVGETLAWSKSLADYPASDGWALDYYFRGPTKFDVSATAETGEDNFSVTVAASVTARCSPGTYSWQAWVSKVDEKYLVASGTAKAIPGLQLVDGNFDGRTDAKKILDAIDALVAGKASLDQQEYMIGAGGAQRQLKRIPIPDLLQLRTHYARIVRAENSRRANKGFQTIRIGFRQPS